MNLHFLFAAVNQVCSGEYKSNQVAAAQELELRDGSTGIRGVLSLFQESSSVSE